LQQQASKQGKYSRLPASGDLELGGRKEVKPAAGTGKVEHLDDSDDDNFLGDD